MSKSGFGGYSKIDSLRKSGFDWSLCQSTFEIDFLLISSIIMHKPSFPAKKMNGMWQKSTIINAIWIIIDSKNYFPAGVFILPKLSRTEEERFPLKSSILITEKVK